MPPSRTLTGDLIGVDGSHVTFDYTVGAVTQSKPIARQLFAPPAATICNSG